MSAYGIAVTEDNLDLITVLNDGVRPLVEKKRTFFICEITNDCRDVTCKIVTEEELQGTSVHEILS